MTDAIPFPDPRELLFPDLPPGEVRTRFGAAPGVTELLDSAEAGDLATARSTLDTMIAGGAETRIRLIAWSILRAAGVEPDPSTAARPRGVVIDIAVDSGLDSVAGWEDGRARYVNEAGGAIVTTGTDAPDAKVREACEALVAAGRGVVDTTDAIVGPRPDPPRFGEAAIWVLTDGGIHGVTGSAARMSLDPLEGPVMALGVRLIQRLTDQARDAG